LPDGRILSAGNEPDHPERTYVLDLSGKETPFTPEGVVAVAVTTDGKRVLTFDLHSQFQLLSLDGGQPQTLSLFQKNEFPIDFTPDDAAVLVRRQGRDGGIEIWRVELAGTKRALLHAVALPGIPSIANGLSATVSRDGKSYAYQYHPSISTEYLVEGLR
jgi:Tol biopolymer transport system component